MKPNARSNDESGRIEPEAPMRVHRPASLTIGVAEVVGGELVVALIVDGTYAVELPIDALDALVAGIARVRRELLELIPS